MSRHRRFLRHRCGSSCFIKWSTSASSHFRVSLHGGFFAICPCRNSKTSKIMGNSGTYVEDAPQKSGGSQALVGILVADVVAAKAAVGGGAATTGTVASAPVLPIVAAGGLILGAGAAMLQGSSPSDKFDTINDSRQERIIRELSQGADATPPPIEMPGPPAPIEPTGPPAPTVDKSKISFPRTFMAIETHATDPKSCPLVQSTTCVQVTTKKSTDKKTKTKCTGPCDYPYQRASDGSRCGGRSAFNRPNRSCSAIRVG